MSQSTSYTFTLPFTNISILQILEAVKEASDWLDENSATATTEDFEEQKEKLSSVAYPITSKLYGSGPGGFDEDDEPADHDEL
jgi:heat shock protein 5